jgi:hypothetical protein
MASWTWWFVSSAEMKIDRPAGWEETLESIILHSYRHGCPGFELRIEVEFGLDDEFDDEACVHPGSVTTNGWC